MSIVLAFSFELGLALSLAAILLSEKNKSNVLPWILMGVLTLVQVIGNVYSTFKYISLSDVEYYQYLAKPLLFFIQDVEENTIQVIVSWIIGAILPIIALMMTDMVATNIKNTSEDAEKEVEYTPEVKEAEEPEDSILSYINEDGHPVWDNKQEETKTETPKPQPAKPAAPAKQPIKQAIKQIVPQKKEERPVIKTSNHISKVQPASDVKHSSEQDKRTANEPYFKGPEVKH